MEKKLIKLEIEDLEERIAPGVLANPAATPPGGNPGTPIAIASAPDPGGTFGPLWLGRAAGC